MNLEVSYRHKYTYMEELRACTHNACMYTLFLHEIHKSLTYYVIIRKIWSWFFEWAPMVEISLQ